ncbi:Maf family protein [Stenoxybacter acetivorans]|uniref:Maf family protein n=1 Tax=Stenoxybacter acetivorans TaxID=422441 RepID=UPI00055F58F1|nr:nucleoside triphosphate pyrophosphatase [Stenoxybacter acetivorans]
MSCPSTLVLASTSRFRQQQLERLNIPFQAAKPIFDETPLAHETAPQTALRLAEGKARSLAADYPNALIIGADQVAFCGNQQLGKPLTTDKAQQMLSFLSGKTVYFYSSVVLLNTAANRIHRHTDTTAVTMRTLSENQIMRYLAQEPDAVHCAGAAKSEGLGTLLIEHINSTDPNALIGLPLFRLIDFLLAEGFPLL